MITKSSKKTRFEFLKLSQEDKDLISKLSPDSEMFSLAELDKGLSGSITLLAKWYIAATGKETKFHVLKIGDPDKLKREYEAIKNIAAPLIKNFPNAVIEYSDDKDKAILSQEFIGNEEGINQSLKQFIERTHDLDKIEEIINTLYQEEIIKWSIHTEKKPKKGGVRKNKKKKTYEEIFQDWIKKGEKKGGLKIAASALGYEYVNNSLFRMFGFGLNKIVKFIQQVYKDELSIKLGPVHGDLHSQNVVLDQNLKICLIDFGWTAIRWQAIDYIWLECSLKFVVCTPYIRIDDFVKVEQMLNEFWGAEDLIPYDSISKMYHGKEIAKIVKGIATIRQNARRNKVIFNHNEYLKGLLIMTASLNTFPQLNRGTLFHSLGVQTEKLGTTNQKRGAYDILYKNSNLLWPSIPGRMVKAAVEY